MISKISRLGLKKNQFLCNLYGSFQYFLNSFIPSVMTDLQRSLSRCNHHDQYSYSVYLRRQFHTKVFFLFILKIVYSGTSPINTLIHFTYEDKHSILFIFQNNCFTRGSPVPIVAIVLQLKKKLNSTQYQPPLFTWYKTYRKLYVYVNIIIYDSLGSKFSPVALMSSGPV